MAVVTCPNTECGIEIDEQVDFCPACALIAPGGAIAQVLRDHAPRLFCHSCGQTILPPGGTLFTEPTQRETKGGYLNDGDRCPACQRVNPTTLRWGDRRAFWQNLGLATFKKGYWFWPLALWGSMFGIVAYLPKHPTAFQHTVSEAVAWLCSLFILFTLSALPSITQKVKPRPFIYRVVRYIFAYGVAYFWAGFISLFIFALLIFLIPAVFDLWTKIMGALLSIVTVCLMVFWHMTIEKRWPHLHLAILKLRGGFWVGLFYRYFRVQHGITAILSRRPMP